MPVFACSRRGLTQSERKFGLGRLNGGHILADLADCPKAVDAGRFLSYTYLR